MANYDIFNGDADGICALVQLRRAAPRRAALVTGVKRDIALFEKIKPRRGDHITALDISMHANKAGLEKALKSGAYVFYVDHHHAGTLPKHDNLFAVIDTRPSQCTSLLVNKALEGAYKEWALVGAFGDNIGGPARALAQELGLSAGEVDKLSKFGTLLNYNAYGRSVSDLNIAPDVVFKRLRNFNTPSQFLRGEASFFERLNSGFEDDLKRAFASAQHSDGLYILADAAWARRISGSFGNALARARPAKAHAVLTHNQDASFTVSVRAPLDNLRGADRLCLGFPTGGGRASAAGINRLPNADLEGFIEAFRGAF